ncbi:MAG: ABC transporter substrate-binding protein [Deltaproteobacteria bacterium]|nr:ABC transporter substrate-binding protein [Deltaproteobacteria bacterium]
MEKHRIWPYLRSLFGGVLLILMFAGPCFAGVPTDHIKETTDRILVIVSDPALKGPENKNKRDQLVRQAVDERFNWEAMTQRSLSRHWRKRTEAEKKEFVALFGKLLDRTYMDKVGNYSGEKVLYVGETIDGRYGTVTTKILTHSQTEVEVRYRLKETNGEWRVYDISIEGVSLVNNYRKQFNSIILRSSYDELVRKLRKKVAEKD